MIVGERVARILLKDGRVLRAQLEGAQPRPRSRAVLTTVLEWTVGQFELTEEAVSGADEVNAEVATLLIEHARMVDERGR